MRPRTMSTSPAAPPIDADAVVIGAGPVGLWQVFELGLLEIRAHVIDTLPHPGGQPGELYADKPIYDIPGLPVCSGQELTDALLRQVAPFQPTLHLGHQVEALARQDDGRFLLTTQQGLQLRARAVFIAAGVGAFVPKRLKVEGLDAFEGRQLFHGLPRAADFSGQRVVVAGGGEAALGAAIRLAALPESQRPASITLLHRRDGFQAEPATIDRLQALRHTGQVRFVPGQVEGIAQESGRLTALHILGPDGATAPLPLDILLVLQGVSPRLGPIADWGMALERKQLVVDTEKFQTSEPGIFAVGDINTYPGKKKLILCGFHEATLAAYAAQPLIAPERELPFQYTTSSSRLHRLLGVDSAPSGGTGNG